MPNELELSLAYASCQISERFFYWFTSKAQAHVVKIHGCAFIKDNCLGKDTKFSRKKQIFKCVNCVGELKVK